MRNTDATVEHLKKQIEFYRGEEDRVSKQLDEIRKRLYSDAAVLELIEAENKREADSASIKAAAYPKSMTDSIPLTYTGTQEGGIGLRESMKGNKLPSTDKD